MKYAIFQSYICHYGNSSFATAVISTAKMQQGEENLLLFLTYMGHSSQPFLMVATHLCRYLWFNCNAQRLALLGWSACFLRAFLWPWHDTGSTYFWADCTHFLPSMKQWVSLVTFVTGLCFCNLLTSCHELCGLFACLGVGIHLQWSRKGNWGNNAESVPPVMFLFKLCKAVGQSYHF